MELNLFFSYSSSMFFSRGSSMCSCGSHVLIPYSSAWFFTWTLYIRDCLPSYPISCLSSSNKVLLHLRNSNVWGWYIGILASYSSLLRLAAVTILLNLMPPIMFIHYMSQTSFVRSLTLKKSRYYHSDYLKDALGDFLHIYFQFLWRFPRRGSAPYLYKGLGRHYTSLWGSSLARTTPVHSSSP